MHTCVYACMYTHTQDLPYPFNYTIRYLPQRSKYNYTTQQPNYGKS